MVALDKIFQEMDESIRRGEGKKVAEALANFDLKEIPKAKKVVFAELARRAGLPVLALRVLHASIRPATGIFHASEFEKVEYAASLVDVGAFDEALELFKTVDVTKAPEGLLLHSFALFSRWEYAATIPLLEKYIETPNLNPYKILVGKANLGAALIREKKYEEGRLLLEELIEVSRNQKLYVIYGNALHLFAQIFFFKKDWEKADRYNEEAGSALQNTANIDILFIRKWRAYIEIYRSKAPIECLKLLTDVKAEALQKGHWETARDCDRVEALISRNVNLFNHLFFGTPFEPFRQRLAEEFGGTVEETYTWMLQNGKNPSLIDLSMAQTLGLDARLKPGQLVHGLLQSLSSDFYRPFRIASLHFKLFPSEYYNPQSAPMRVHTHIHRLRKWFEDSGLPFLIQEKNSQYFLSATKPAGIRIRRSAEGEQKYLWLLQRVEQGALPDTFSSTDVANLLKISTRSVTRRLTEAVDEGVLIRVGQGRNTLYRKAA